ncbi:MAG: hypothetical protein ABSF58_12780, partial [Solirubrobacteraceae bacterium]
MVWSAMSRAERRAGSPAPVDRRAQPGAVRRGDPVISAIAIGTFLLGSAIWIHRKGLFIHTDTVVLWVVAGLF